MTEPITRHRDIESLKTAARWPGADRNTTVIPRYPARGCLRGRRGMPHWPRPPVQPRRAARDRRRIALAAGRPTADQPTDTQGHPV